jgi:methionine--tRNA ligase beta chain
MVLKYMKANGKIAKCMVMEFTMEKITIDEFKKIDIRLGKILTAEKVPDTDKLIRLTVDLGEESPRQIVSGIASYIQSPEDLIGKIVPFVANLEPRMLRGLESSGMLLAAHSVDDVFSFVVAEKELPTGTRLG